VEYLSETARLEQRMKGRLRLPAGKRMRGILLKLRMLGIRTTLWNGRK